MTAARVLHVISTVLLAVGFVGVAWSLLSSNFGPPGVPIGLVLLMPLFLASGAGAVVVGVIAFALARRGCRRDDVRPIRS
jgi:hypothetical protein